MANANRRLVAVPPEVRDPVREKLKSLGAREAARQLHVGRHVVLAVAAEEDISPGSLALLQLALAGGGAVAGAGMLAQLNRVGGRF